MQMINLDVPNVYLYVISLINKIEKYLTDPKTSYQDISSYLGNVNTEHDLSYLLTDIHELLCHNNQDLDILANKLLNKNKDKTLKKTIK